MPGMGILAAGAFTAIDWLIVIVYLAAVVAVGLWASRGSGAADAFFLAARRMPMWAVAISLLATAQSAATFVGGPQEAYDGDLTYLSTNLGTLIAVVIVAVFFVPAYYRQRVTSVYELIGQRYGTVSQRCASAMFMLGRVFASGARLFIVAIPFSLIAFGDITSGSMIASILLIAAVAAAYTMAGGIRAVIWTDVMQAAVYIGTIVIVLAVLWQKVPVGIGELIDTLRDGADAGKLKVLDTSADLSRPYTLWAVLIGFSLLNMAAYGADQDLTQRLLTCKTARAGSWSVIVSNLIGWPVILLFLLT
ncbi:MAG: sodium:solute symporter family transporter, partial [Planctomycetota bacterium]